MLIGAGVAQPTPIRLTRSQSTRIAHMLSDCVRCDAIHTKQSLCMLFYGVTGQETAVALAMQNAGGEIVAILTERLHTLGATPDLVCKVPGTLISADWIIQKLWEGNDARSL